MTALEKVVEKGYNPFNTKLTKKNNIYMVVDKLSEKVIVKFIYTPDGYQKILN